MATKKAAAKKPAGKKSAAKKTGTSKGKEVKVVIEVIVRNENVAAPPTRGRSANMFTTAAVPVNLLEGTPEANFKFKFTPAEGVKLSKIDIDGSIFRGSDLVNASETDADGNLVISVFADVMTTPISMILEAVGEPNRSMGFTLKFENKDVFKADDDKKITIQDNRFGFLALPAVNLP